LTVNYIKTCANTSDIGGILGRGRTTFLIEVKGHVSSRPSGFNISENEWLLAKKCREEGDKQFLIAGVCVYPSPHIVYWLVDPYSLYLL
jgi:hypothetical protein